MMKSACLSTRLVYLSRHSGRAEKRLSAEQKYDDRLAIDIPVRLLVSAGLEGWIVPLSFVHPRVSRFASI